MYLVILINHYRYRYWFQSINKSSSDYLLLAPKYFFLKGGKETVQFSNFSAGKLY